MNPGNQEPASEVKLKHLHIRASAAQKAALERAAKRKNMNVSQFVLQSSLKAAADTVPVVESLVVSEAEYRWLLEKLEEPPRDLPELRKLLNTPSVFEK